MNEQRNKLSSRDYKHGGRGGPTLLQRYQQFLAGLALGLFVALLVYLSGKHQRVAAAEELPPVAHGKSAAVAPDTEDPPNKYDFYEMLPKFEVVVPEKEHDVHADLPSVAVSSPGVYVLQAGSYRNQPEAERMRSMLAKQGIEATVQRVQVDDEVWHRVRIGPIRDLKALNESRASLRKADIDVIVIRIGD
ncbi:MAG: SPOR domain-containing protein [Pseudomonadota bacterium]